MCDLVIPDDVDTYFNVDIDTRINNSLCLKNSWVTMWQKSIFASVKRAEQDAKWLTGQIWKYCNRDHAPSFFVRQNWALKSPWNQAKKRRNSATPNYIHLRDMRRNQWNVPPVESTPKDSLLRTRKTCPASEAFSRPPEDERNDEHGEEKNALSGRSTTGLETAGTNNLDIVAMASDRGGSACVFYSFQVR